MRLHVFLAKAGVASRRASEELIRQGRVRVNGAVVTVMGSRVEENDEVTCDGRPVSLISRLVHLAMHKPVAVLCTQHDNRDRKKVIDLIPADLRPGLFHAGRLDFMSSGLVFYTNDGDLAKIVTHPSFGVEKEYRLETNDPVPARMLSEYKKGIEIDGEILIIHSFRLENPSSVTLILTQGKNREIRRVCAVFGVQVKRLTRIRIGPVFLKGLSPGRFRFLTGEEIEWFKARIRKSPPASPPSKKRD